MIKLTNRMMVAAMLVAASVGNGSGELEQGEDGAHRDGVGARARGGRMRSSATPPRAASRSGPEAPANTSYDVVVGGIKVGSITTKNNGSAKIRFEHPEEQRRAARL